MNTTGTCENDTIMALIFVFWNVQPRRLKRRLQHAEIVDNIHSAYRTRTETVYHTRPAHPRVAARDDHVLVSGVGRMAHHAKTMAAVLQRRRIVSWPDRGTECDCHYSVRIDRKYRWGHTHCPRTGDTDVRHYYVTPSVNAFPLHRA